eukprot:9550939-Alexandrium_andersonii.AAC.1
MASIATGMRAPMPGRAKPRRWLHPLPSRGPAAQRGALPWRGQLPSRSTPALGGGCQERWGRKARHNARARSQ